MASEDPIERHLDFIKDAEQILYVSKRAIHHFSRLPEVEERLIDYRLATDRLKPEEVGEARERLELTRAQPLHRARSPTASHAFTPTP